MDFFFLSKNHVIEEIFKLFLWEYFFLFWVILKNPQSNFQIFTFSECKDDLTSLFTSQNQSQLLPSQLLQHKGQEPHLEEPQHFVLLLHIHLPFSSMAVAKNEKLRNFLAWLLYAWGMPYGPRKTLQKPLLTSPSPWGSAQTPPKSKGSPLSKVKIENN